MGSSEEPTKQILAKLGVIFLVFYALYFIAAAIMSAAFLEEFDAKMPFQMDEFDPGHSQHIAPWLAMVVAFVCAIGLMFWVVRSSARTWDYATTLSIIHWVVSMCVMGEFPTNWIWWVTICVMTLVVGSLGWMANMYRENTAPSPIKPMGA